MPQILRFRFSSVPDRQGVESDACLAIFSAECLYGRPKTRLDVSYLVEATGQSCVFQVLGDAGDVATQVFIGLCTERFGEDGFEIEQVDAVGGGQ